MKVSKRDLYLLLALAGVIIAFCAWKFGFEKLNAKTERLRTDTIAIQADIDKYSAVKNNIDIYQKGIEDLTTKIAGTLNKFPSNLLTEDVYMLTRELEVNNEVTYVSSASIGTTVNSYNAQASSVAYKLFESKVSMSYTTSYQGFKEMLNYINGHPNRMSVENFAVSYDTSSGLLSGSSTVNVFYVTGTDKEYIEQNLSSVKIGTDNIFGTVESSNEE